MKKGDTVNIVFAGGGTGGHIYPGIAVADATRKLFAENNIPVKIYWIGNKSGMDRNIVENNLFPNGSIDSFIGIPSGKLRRYFSFQNFTDFFKIIGGVFKSFFVLRKLKPQILFSKGGFVSVPPCLVARILKIPYFTHECDFTPGLATKLNAGGAKKILLSYEETKKYLSPEKAKNAVVTGNPVRPVFYSDVKKTGIDFIFNNESFHKPVLLVLGGSLGARQINNLIMENLEWLKERFVVVHQTGKAFAEENPEVMSAADDSYKPFAFIYGEMPGVIQASDVILSRAGANSIWECAVCAKPMVLVPLCGSGTRGDQVDNAEYVQEKGCARVLLGKNADSAHLRESLELFLDSGNRELYSKNCRILTNDYVPAEKIAALIMEEVCSR